MLQLKIADQTPSRRGSVSGSNMQGMQATSPLQRRSSAILTPRSVQGEGRVRSGVDESTYLSLVESDKTQIVVTGIASCQVLKVNMTLADGTSKSITFHSDGLGKSKSRAQQIVSEIEIIHRTEGIASIEVGQIYNPHQPHASEHADIINPILKAIKAIESFKNVEIDLISIASNKPHNILDADVSGSLAEIKSRYKEVNRLDAEQGVIRARLYKEYQTLLRQKGQLHLSEKNNIKFTRKHGAFLSMQEFGALKDIAARQAYIDRLAAALADHDQSCCNIM